MNIRSMFKTAEKFAVDNSPGIFTGLGVAGTVMTAVLAGKASYSAALLIQDEAYARKNDNNGVISEISTKEKVGLVWREYIPTAAVGATSITAIIMANRVGARRAAAMTAAFKLSEKLSEEYRQKAQEVLGAKAEEKLRSDLNAKRMSENATANTIIITGSETIFYDAWSGRYFKCEMENLRKAVNDVNHQVNRDFYASLSDFYDLVGLDHTQESDEIGWNSDELLELNYSAVMDKQGRPVIAIEYETRPIRGFCRVN